MLKNQTVLFRTLRRPVCRSVNTDNDAGIRWQLPINEVALHVADDILAQLEGNYILWVSPAFNVRKITQLTAQMAAESCPTGKSSERKCLIVTLSARIPQSRRLGFVYFSEKCWLNLVVELYPT